MLLPIDELPHLHLQVGPIGSWAWCWLVISSFYLWIYLSASFELVWQFHLLFAFLLDFAFLASFSFYYRISSRWHTADSQNPSLCYSYSSSIWLLLMIWWCSQLSSLNSILVIEALIYPIMIYQLWAISAQVHRAILDHGLPLHYSNSKYWWYWRYMPLSNPNLIRVTGHQQAMLPHDVARWFLLRLEEVDLDFCPRSLLSFYS